MADLSREHGVSDGTVYKWNAKYDGMDVNKAMRLKALKDENGKLKKLLADAMLDNSALKDLLGKNGRDAGIPAIDPRTMDACAKRHAVVHLVEGHGMSERRACRVIGCCRMTIRDEAIRQDDPLLRERLKELAKVRRRFGYDHLLLYLRAAQAAIVS